MPPTIQLAMRWIRSLAAAQAKLGACVRRRIREFISFISEFIDVLSVRGHLRRLRQKFVASLTLQLCKIDIVYTSLMDVKQRQPNSTSTGTRRAKT